MDAVSSITNVKLLLARSVFTAHKIKKNKIITSLILKHQDDGRVKIYFKFLKLLCKNQNFQNIKHDKSIAVVSEFNNMTAVIHCLYSNNQQEYILLRLSVTHKHKDKGLPVFVSVLIYN